jgi:CSLREA domain-containing protein
MSSIQTGKRSRILVGLILSMLMIFSIMTPRQARAATLTVDTLNDENDGSCSDGDCSLRDAIQVAAAGDTINFNVTGTIVLTLGELTVDKDLTISGPEPENLTIDGNHTTQIFYVTGGSTVFSGLTIANGYTLYGFGGGMYNTGDASLTNVTFSANSAGFGGGMDNWGTTTLTNVTFRDNTAGFGGGIYNYGDSTSRLTNVTFSGNSVTHYGGGMYNDDGSTSTLTNVTFSGNSAGDGGGGMFNSNGSYTLTKVTFSDNSAGYGGGMSNFGISTLAEVTFSGNSAGGEGGGMYTQGTSTLTIATFSGNSAAYGGGIYNLSGTSTLTNVTFSDNSASYDGGGMSNFGISTLTSVTFSSNSDNDVGAGMFNGDTSTLTNVTFSGNFAPEGGGMGNNGSSTLTNVTFSGNSATIYGGGGMYNSGTSTLTNVTFSGNSAAASGGGMNNVIFSTTMLTNVTFNGNSASSGGGVYVESDGSLILKNTLLAGGDAPNGPDCAGTVTSYGYNLIQDTSGCIIMDDQTGNIYGEDPLLGPLGHYGGYTLMHSLLKGSPAIDAASSTDPNGNLVTVDQRGVTRPQGPANDIGAYEFVNQMTFWLPIVLK